jgi:hypothetical protein
MSEVERLRAQYNTARKYEYVDRALPDWGEVWIDDGYEGYYEPYLPWLVKDALKALAPWETTDRLFLEAIADEDGDVVEHRYWIRQRIEAYGVEREFERDETTSKGMHKTLRKVWSTENILKQFNQSGLTSVFPSDPRD